MVEDDKLVVVVAAAAATAVVVVEEGEGEAGSDDDDEEKGDGLAGHRFLSRPFALILVVCQKSYLYTTESC